MRVSGIFVVGLVSLPLAACGTSATDRAMSGAGIGAGVGAATAAVTDGNLARGALIGGAAGALAGVATNPNDVYLGRPVWR